MHLTENSTRRAQIAAAIAATSALALFTGACGSDSSPDGVQVSASTGIVADITEEVAGHDAEVVQVIPNSSSPHDFQLSVQDRADVEESDLLVTSGAGLETGIPIDEVGTDTIALADQAPDLLPDDPHFWMDPARVAATIPALGDALADADPEHADGYRKRAADYAAELEELDVQIEEDLASIPPERRDLVTSHDALGYFADRYGFEVVATPFPASGPESEPSAQAIADVEDAIRSSGVPTVFATEEDDPDVLRQIAERTGVEITEDLLVESPGSAGTYVDMLRRDAELISEGLGRPSP